MSGILYEACICCYADPANVVVYSPRYLRCCAGPANECGIPTAGVRANITAASNSIDYASSPITGPFLPQGTKFQHSIADIRRVKFKVADTIVNHVTAGRAQSLAHLREFGAAQLRLLMRQRARSAGLDVGQHTKSC